MWEWLKNYGGFLGLPSINDISSLPERWAQMQDESGEAAMKWGVDPAWLEHQRMGLPPMQTDFITEIPSTQDRRSREATRLGLLEESYRRDDQKRKDDHERFQRDRMQRFLRK